MTERATAPPARPGVSLWIILWTTALATRIVFALLLPNAEQDGYSYAEMIAHWSARFSAGQFRLSDLFGFWLPLYPLTAAIPNIWIGHSLVAGKMLSAISGATSCVLVFGITQRLLGSIGFACVTFGILLTSPLHILYSAACMTDVPEGCLILASLWFVMRRWWVVAAIFAAISEGVRVEGWILVLLLPALQFLYQRRISFLVLLVLLLPLIGWLAVCQIATGDPFTFFAFRAHYQASYMDFFSSRKGFAFSDVARDVDYFLLGVNRGVVLAAATAGLLLIGRALRFRKPIALVLAAPLAYGAALSALVVVAYVIKQQPVLFPRYGLILFAVSLPLFAWLLRHAFDFSARRSVKLIAFTAILMCLWDGKRQLAIIPKVIGDYQAHRQIAQTVATCFRKPGETGRCFSDDAAVRVLSGLPAESFVRSQSAPSFVWGSVSAFERYLRENRVSHVVLTEIENSLPTRFFPGLSHNAAADPILEFIACARSPFAPDVWLFRLRERAGPAP